jgi:TetR/AcrR family transcriptional repressor of nem operon
MHRDLRCFALLAAGESETEQRGRGERAGCGGAGRAGRRASEREILSAVQNWDDLQRWAAAIVTGIEKRHARGGCPTGTLAASLADTDETARQRLEQAFAEWGEAIGIALTRLRDNGLLPPDADLPALTTATLASLQGGLLLAKTAHDSAPLRIALHAAISYLKYLAAAGDEP